MDENDNSAKYKDSNLNSNLIFSIRTYQRIKLMCSNFLPQYAKDVFDHITQIEENHNIVESFLT